MGHVLMSNKIPKLTVPYTGIKLGDIAEGSIVKLNESGSPVEFYVAKHDYESALNGSGRTLLVRKDCSGNTAFDSSSPYTNQYENSNIDNYFNNTYLNMFDSGVKTAISKTKFYYTIGYGDKTISTLERAVFTLSAKELGFTASNFSSTSAGHTINAEGARLPVYNALRQAYYNGTLDYWYLRTPLTDDSSFVCITKDGTTISWVSSNGARNVRPCFTFQSGALFDEDTILFNGKVV